MPATIEETGGGKDLIHDTSAGGRNSNWNFKGARNFYKMNKMVGEQGSEKIVKQIANKYFTGPKLF